MAVTFVNAGAVATGANPSVTTPASMSIGDLMLIVVTSGAATSTPSGWTQYYAQGSGRFLTIFYRIRGSSQGAVTLSNSNTTTKAVMLAYRGGVISARQDPITTGSSAAPTTGTLTTTRNDTRVISLYASNITPSNTWTPNGSTTSRVNSASSGSVNGLLIADETQVVKGTSTARAATLNASVAWAALQMSIIPTNTYYWVGGSGTWNNTDTANWSLTSGGASAGETVQSYDDVIIDSNSGTGTITPQATSACQSLTVTASQALTIGAGTLNIYGSISTPAGGSFAFNTTLDALTLNFLATGTGRTVTTGGKAYPSLTFNSSTGAWTLSDNLTCQNLTVTAGSLTASGRTINTLFLNISNGTTVNFSTANVTVTSGNIFLTGSGITVTSATFTALGNIISLSSVTGTGSNHNCRNFSSNVAVNTVNLTTTENSPGSVSSSASIGNVSLTAPTWDGLAEYSIGGSGIISNLSGNGSSFTRRIFAYSATTGTRRNVNGGGTRNYVDYRDIGFGSAVTGTSLGDCGNNSNITFDAPRTLYVVASGTWNSSTTFSLSSTGGSTANLYPLAQDTVAFTDDALASGDTTTLLKGNFGQFRAETRTLPLTINYGNFSQTFYGNHILPSSVTLAGTFTRTFSSNSPSSSITVSLDIANQIPSSIVFLKSYIFDLDNDLNVSGSISNSSGQSAQFTSSNYNITCGSFSWNATSGLLTLGTSTITVNDSSGPVFTITGTSPISAASSTLVLANDSPSSLIRTVAAGTSKTLGTVVIGGTNANTRVVFTAATDLTISTLSSTKTVAYEIGFPTGITTTITNWNISGTPGNPVSIGAANTAFGTSSATISVTNRTSGIDYLEFYRITNTTPTGLVNLYAGTNSKLYYQTRGIAVTNPIPNTNIILLTSGTSWTVPADWNSYSNSNHTVHLFGGGAGGAKSRFASPSYIVGNGGGGGAYVQAVNPLNTTAGSAITYQIGTGGAGGTSTTGGSGGSTTFNASAFSAGGGGNTGAGGNPGATGAIRTSGGAGGSSTQSTSSPALNAYTGSAGGGGAGGPNGNGGAGGNARYEGFGFSGGGGNGGGTSGQLGQTGYVNGNGGNNSLGIGGGTPSSIAFNGGGGGYSTTLSDGSGSSGIDTAAGMGGGGGASFQSNAGFFGGGGASGFINNSGGTLFYANGSAGAQGAIIIMYATGPATPTSSNFFLLF